MHSLKRHVARVLVVVTSVATLVLPGWVAPTIAVSMPRTMARSLTRVADGLERVTLDFRATHVGFSWVGEEGTGVRYRTIDDQGIASHWRSVPEAHDLEYGDHHFSGVQVLDRPVALEWHPSGPPGRTIENVSVDYMNTVDGPLDTYEIPATAEATAETPHIVTRAGWGADEDLKSVSGGCRRRFFRPQQLFVHHTAGSNNDPNPAATMRAIYHFHVVDRGWCDIGYNFVIARDGTIFEGRWSREFRPWETHDSEDINNNAVVGAHVEGFNSGSVGTSLMGNYTSATLPAAARSSLIDVLSWEADRHNLDPEGTHTYRNPETGRRQELHYIAGHRAAGQTECPGDTVAKDLKNIRREVALQIGAGKTSSKLALTPMGQTIVYGDTASISGLLSTRAGAPLAERVVTLYARKPHRPWVETSEATTSPDGTFAFSKRPVKKTMLVVSYAGDPTTWDTDSRVAQILVRPKVTLEAREPASVDDNAIAHYPPGTTTIPVGGEVTPPHPGEKVIVRVQKIRPDGERILVAALKPKLGSEGAYSATFKEASSAKKYRLITWFQGDDDHEFATSNSVFVQVDP